MIQTGEFISTGLMTPERAGGSPCSIGDCIELQYLTNVETGQLLVGIGSSIEENNGGIVIATPGNVDLAFGGLRALRLADERIPIPPGERVEALFGSNMVGAELLGRELSIEAVEQVPSGGSGIHLTDRATGSVWLTHPEAEQALDEIHSRRIAPGYDLIFDQGTIGGHTLRFLTSTGIIDLGGLGHAPFETDDETGVPILSDLSMQDVVEPTAAHLDAQMVMEEAAQEILGRYAIDSRAPKITFHDAQPARLLEFLQAQ